MITLRSALFNVVFFAVSFGLTVLATVVRLVAPERVMVFAILWARALVAAARIICGIRLEVSGLEHIRPGAALIASRHQSAFDTFVWLTLLPRCCYVFKQELLRKYPEARVIEFPGEDSYWVRIRPEGDNREQAEFIEHHMPPSDATADAFLTRLD